MGRWLAATAVAWGAIMVFAAALGAFLGSAPGGAVTGAMAGILLAPFCGITIAGIANGAVHPDRANWLRAALAAAGKGLLLAGVGTVGCGLAALAIWGGGFETGCVAGAGIAGFLAMASCVGQSLTPPSDELPRLR